MFLKAIELQGFKSFADKTKVSFDKGVTAVVGPNGSGKSNITESLRWALGESSAKNLRGGKMPDVIFAGTQNRKAQNYAAVKVVLDNSDQFLATAGQTVTVERHIYRNGDNDYLIDGKKVRLKDIHSLFMDTGLGRDSFSIISQGRVEAIFNSKAEDRRLIFEEAAGVLKYKTRKKETQTKLNQTQDNLDRLEDIIYELDGQVKPLVKQAEKARQFLVLDEQRQKLQLNLLVADIDSSKADQAQLETDLASSQEALASYHQQRESLEETNQTLKQTRHRLTEQISQVQHNLLELTRLSTELQGKMERQALEQAQGQKSRQEAEQQLASHQAEAQDLEGKLANSRSHYQELTRQVQAVQEDIKGLDSQLLAFAQSPDQLIEDLRDQYVQIMQVEANLSNQLTQLDSQLDQVKASQLQAAEASQQLDKEVVAAKIRTQQALEAYQASQAKLADLLAAYKALADQVTTSRDQYSQKQASYFDQLDAIKTLEAKVASLEAIHKNHSNFYAGVRAVLQAGDRLSGIVGAVSQSLTFDVAYQTALEIALGAASQHIIVADEAAAKRAIDFLKTNRQGRATFLPLTTIKPRRLPDHHLGKLQRSPGFLGLASDLVSFEPAYEQIFQNLLGATAIFETTDQANQAARQLNYQVRLVTLDGTELRPGGSFSGGANRQASTTFIQPELDQLKAQLTDKKAGLQTLEDQLAKLKNQLDQDQADLQVIKEEGESSRLTKQADKLAYDQASQALASLTASQEALDQADGDRLTQDLHQQKAQVQAQLASQEQARVELQQSIESIKADKSSIEDQVASLRQSLSQAQIRVSELQAEQGFEQKTQIRLEEELSRLQDQMAGLTAYLSDQDQILDDQTLETLARQAQEAQARQEAEQALLVRLRFELEDCEGQLEDIEERLTKAFQQNDGLIRQQASLEAKLDQVNNRLQGFARQLSEDYQMSLTEAKAAAEPLDNLAQARQTLKDLQGQIKALGPINLEAIDQYEEVNERLTFLSGQRDDLLGAKNMLQATIDDMDGEVKARFKTTFEAIRESFKTTFTQMFGGGSADLVLTENDILTAGVEISVQPPGKKIQSLNLMSGGEKALSALALLFAIIRVKTIPFVILDEVEAALDEANVKRFGDYLNRFDKSSQFIVVTHRKGTMVAADSIYGVTMQESGVSKIVSVKLKDAEALVK